MNLENIKKIYLWGALASIAVALLLLFVPAHTELTDRILSFTIGNIGYHLFYFGIGKVPIFQLTQVSMPLGMKRFLIQGLLLLSVVAMLASLYLIYLIVQKIIATGDFLGIAGLIVIAGGILGSLRMHLALRSL